jgi:hypothetical protein
VKPWAIALAVANILVLAWWQGWLSPLVEPPGHSEREPLRAARQLQPEAVRATPPRPAPTRPGSAANTTTP